MSHIQQHLVSPDKIDAKIDKITNHLPGLYGAIARPLLKRAHHKAEQYIKAGANGARTVDRPMLGVVYVDRNDVDSILTNGYLSARAQYNMNATKYGPILINKYKQQFQDALQDPEDGPLLQKLLSDQPEQSEVQQIMTYLDWREINTEQGSKAVYFSFAGIPFDAAVRDGIRLQRNDFLHNRVPLYLPIKDNMNVYVIQGVETPLWYRNQNAEYWTNVWLEALRKDTNNNSLWFANVPHGFVVPYNGKLQAYRTAEEATRQLM